MPVTTRATLKSRFQTGLVPTQDDFANLIDSALNPAEDNLTKDANGPLRIGYGASSDALQKVIEFFRGAVSGTAAWSVGLSGAAGRQGFSIFHGVGVRLFLNEIGRVGILTSEPNATLHVAGTLQIDQAANLQATLNVQGATTLNGNVGIGTNSPGHALEVRRNVEGWLALFQNTNPGGGAVHLAHGGGRGAHIDAGTDASASTAALEVVSNGQSRLFVRGDGWLGIGTGTPDTPVHIASNITGWAAKIQNTNPGGGVVHLAHGNGYGADIDAGTDATASTYALNVASNGQSRLFVRGDGRVGIGTGGPQEKLTVHGNILLTQPNPESWGSSAIFFSETNYSIYAGLGQMNLASPFGCLIKKSGSYADTLTLEPGNLRLQNGSVYSRGNVFSTGDFSELFESENKEQISVGTSVVLTQEGQIRPAKGKEKPIGVIASAPAILCNSADEWPQKYLKNEFGQFITEEVEEESTLLNGEKEMIKVQKPVLNPAYDPNREYIPREKRPEWHPVGLLGQLHLSKGQPVAPTWVKIKDVSENVELWLVK